MGGRGGASHGATGGGRLGSVRDFLRQAYGVRHANAILDILRKAPAHIQDMWIEFAGQFRSTPDLPGNSWYDPREDSVHLNIATVATGKSARGIVYKAPYQTVFHEYGHMTDSLISRSNGYFRYEDYSALYQGIGPDGKAILRKDAQGGLLGRTAKEEMKGHIARMFQTYGDDIDRAAKSRNLNERYVAANLLAGEAKKKYSSLVDRSDLSDMFEGAGIGIAYPMGTGHNLDYWARVDNGAEIFAEIISAEASNAGSLKAIKDYFPQTYKVYQDMVKARKKK